MSHSSWSNDTPRRIVVVVGTPYSGIFFYDPVPGHGNLVGSWTVQAGTDPYGNAYPAGFNQQVNGAGDVTINALGILLQTINPNVDEPTSLTASQIGAFAAAYDEFDLTGPRDSTNTEQFLFTLRSASQDGSQRAQMLLRLLHGTSVNVLTADFAGAHLLGDTTAVHPGTGTSAVQAVAETWQSPVLTTSFRSDTISHPLRYRLESCGGSTVVRLDGGVQTQGAGPWAAGIDITTLPAGYRPAAGTRAYVTKSAVLAGANQGTVQVLNTGEVQLGVTFTASGQQVFFDGVTFPIN